MDTILSFKQLRALIKPRGIRHYYVFLILFLPNFLISNSLNTNSSLDKENIETREYAAIKDSPFAKKGVFKKSISALERQVASKLNIIDSRDSLVTNSVLFVENSLSSCSISNPGIITSSCVGENDLQFTIYLTGSGVGGTYNVFELASGTGVGIGSGVGVGTYSMNSLFTINGGADGTDKVLTVIDTMDNTCMLNINVAGSEPCFGINNPDLPNDADSLDVLFIIEESSSISNLGSVTAVRNALKNVLNNLNGTGSRAAITTFGSQGWMEIGYTSITNATLSPGGVFGDYLDDAGTGPNYRDGYNPSDDSCLKGGVNWEAGFRAALHYVDGDTSTNYSCDMNFNPPVGAAAPTNPAYPDFVFFLAATDPNFALDSNSNNSNDTSLNLILNDPATTAAISKIDALNNSGQRNQSTSPQAAATAAISEVNKFKNNGSHILTVLYSSQPDSNLVLNEITGPSPVVWNRSAGGSSNIRSADYVNAPSSTDLTTIFSRALHNVVCGIDGPNLVVGNCLGNDNLTFDLNLTATNGSTTYTISGATPSTGTYGVNTTFTITGGADGMNKTVTITDSGNSSCTKTIEISGNFCCTLGNTTTISSKDSTGYIKTILTTAGVTSPDSAVGAVDSTFAVFDVANEYLIVELDNKVPSGETLTVDLNLLFIAGTFKVSVSDNNVNYSDTTNFSVGTGVNIPHQVKYAIPSGYNPKYVRIELSSGQLRLDAISHSKAVAYICTPQMKPIAKNDTIGTNEDMVVSIDILSNDLDPDGILSGDSITIISPALFGMVVDNMDSTLSYTPNQNKNGTDSLQYQICDSGAPSLCDTAWVFFQIAPVNDPPVIDNDTITTPEDTPISGDLTDMGDYDPDSTVLTTAPVLVKDVLNGSLTVQTNGTYTYTPNLHFHGQDTAVVSICDAGTPSPIQCAFDTLLITVTPVNDSLVVDNEFHTILEDMMVSGDLTDAGDFDPDSTTLVVTTSPIDSSNNGSISIMADGNYTYTPNLNYFGADTIIVEICDSGFPLPKICAHDTIFITINQINDPITANNDTVTINEDTPISFDILSNDNDPDGILSGDSVAILSTPLLGMVVDNMDSTLTYTPTSNLNGLDSLQYQICDSGLPSDCDTAWVFINITPVNDPPVVDNETHTILEDNTANGDLTDGGDVDPDGTSLTVNTSPISGPNLGSISVMSNGLYTYTPNLNSTGLDTIIISICDNGSPAPNLCSNDTIFINITPVNDAPIVDNEAHNTNEDTPVSGDLTNGGDYDPDGTTLTTITSPIDSSDNGGITINSDGTYTYTPNPNYFGQDTIIVEICDMGIPSPNICVPDTIFINVVSINDPVIAKNDSITTLENTSVTLNILSNDTDLDGALSDDSVKIITHPVQGMVTDNKDSTITYTPNLNVNGLDSIEYAICDIGSPSICDTAWIIINVSDVNNPPIVDNESHTFPEDSSISGDVTDAGDSDPEGTPLVVNTSPIDSSNNGSFSILANGTYTYTPNANYAGPDTVIIEICDSGIPAPICVPDTIFLEITPVNDPPIVDNETHTTMEDTPVSGDLIDAGDYDIEGTPLSATLTLMDSLNNGSLSFTADGAYTYTPNLNFSGLDTIIVEICDAGVPIPNQCVNDTVFITVTGVNDAPIAQNDTVSTSEDTLVTISILVNDSDIDGILYADSISILDSAITGSLIINADSTIQYTPNTNFSGLDSLQYKVCDNSSPSLCDSAWVFINVLPYNDAPILDNEVHVILEDSNASGDLTDGGDYDPEGDSLVVNLTPIDLPNAGNISITANGNYTYTPIPNYTGPDTIIVQICDMGMPSPVKCANDTIFISINGVNDAPILDNEHHTTAEDTPVSGDLTDGGDYDIEGTTLFATLIPIDAANNGMLSLTANGNYTYTPNLNYVGLDTIVIQICDSGFPAPSQCSNDTIFIQITPINDAPLALNDSTTTNEDQAVSINILNNDTDPETGLSKDSVSIITNPNFGSVVNNLDSTFIYTPTSNANGLDSLQYSICDSDSPSQCDSAWVFITVNPVNDPPVLDDEYLTLAEDGLIIGDLTNAGDYDPDGTNLIVNTSPLTAPKNGTFTVDIHGTYNYTPFPNFNGKDTIIVQVCDLGIPGPAACANNTFFITVNPVNDPPIIDNETHIIGEDEIAGGDLTDAGDYDPDSTALVVTINPIDSANHGSIEISVNGIYTYTPNMDYTGLDTVIVEICDSGTPSPNICRNDTIFIEIIPTNDAPMATRDSFWVLEESTTVLNLLLNDTDAEGDLHGDSFNLIGSVLHGSVVDNNDSTITYTPMANFVGLDSIQYEICDTSSLGSKCDTAWVILIVNQINDAPIAQNDTITGTEDNPLSINVLINDTDIDGNLKGDSIRILVQTPNGVAVDNNDSTITYTPTTNFFGLDSLQYEICDSTANPLNKCDTAWVFFNINPVNDPPVVDNEWHTIMEGSTLGANLIDAGDYDPDSTTLTANSTPLYGPKGGTISIALNGYFTYIPNADFSGNDTIIASICDAGTPAPSLCSPDTIFIYVSPINDAPIAQPDSVITSEDMPLSINVLKNDTDIDSDLLGDSIKIIITPTRGSLSGNTDSIIVYTPSVNYNGRDSFQYAICDNMVSSLCDTAWVQIQINPVNDPPIANRDLASVNEDGFTTVNVLLNDTDTDGGLRGDSVRLIILPNHGGIINHNDSTLRYTPTPNFFGLDSVLYRICDTSALGTQCDSAWLVINVLPVNDPPNANYDNTSTNEDVALLINIINNDTDIDGSINPASITFQQLPPFGTVVNNNNGSITYTPNANFYGLDSLRYQVCDTGTPLPARCDSAMVYIEVHSINDLPQAVIDRDTTDEEQTVSINVLQNDTDIDGVLDTSSLTINDMPSNGSAMVNNDGSITYIPNTHFNGLDTLMYVVCEKDSLGCDSAYIYVVINPVNDQPIANDDTINAVKNTAIQISVTNNDSDPNDPLGSINLASIDTIAGSSTKNGSITIHPTTGVITYTPDNEYIGLDSLEYIVCDNGNPSPALCDTAKLIINVLEQNIHLSDAQLNIHVWLEGAYEDGQMRTTLNDLGYLPGQNPSTFLGTATAAGHPYNMAPWNYNGTEGSGMSHTLLTNAGYANTVVDWILVSLRTGINRASTVCTKAALLHSDGHIEFLTGFNTCNIDTTNSYYVVVEHRNHLISMSHQAVSIVNNTINYDFRTQDSYKGLFGTGQKLVDGKYMMFAANGDQALGNSGNRILNIIGPDKDNWQAQNGNHSSYYIYDYDLNGDINVRDKIFYILNNGTFSDVPWEN
jgi:VCBS repeat-containing protein